MNGAGRKNISALEVKREQKGNGQVSTDKLNLRIYRIEYATKMHSI